jgi:hypothetical protein
MDPTVTINSQPVESSVGWQPNWPFAAQQGWQCPCCKRVYAPQVVKCMYCPSEATKVESATTSFAGTEGGK